LQLSVSQINFGSSASGVMSNQTITLKNTGSGNAIWQASTDPSWLTVFPKSDTFVESENIKITANRGGIASGDYTGHVTFWLQGQENTPSALNVTMTVGPLSPQLSVSTTSLSYSTAQSQNPESQVVTIANTGGQALRWDATATTQDGAPWLTLSLYHGVIPSGVSQALTVQVQSQTLSAGTYNGLISFTGDADAQVQVALTIATEGNLVISPSSLALTTQQSSQTLSLQNNGGLPLDWKVRYATNDSGNWLSATPASGTLAPGASATITVRADPTNLAPGSYQGMLIFSSGDQTQQVSVSFVVTGTTPVPATPTSTPTKTEHPKENAS
jgi:hypothetical protein